MTTESAHDPRPTFTQALDQAGRQVAAVGPDELSNRTPRAEYDVRALLGHVVAVLHKLARVGTGGNARDLPDVIDGIADDGWASAGARRRRRLHPVGLLPGAPTMVSSSIATMGRQSHRAIGRAAPAYRANVAEPEAGHRW